MWKTVGFLLLLLLLNGHLKLNTMLNQDFNGRHEGRDLRKAGSRHHGGVIGQSVGVVRGAQVRDEIKDRVTRRSGQLENKKQKKTQISFGRCGMSVCCITKIIESFQAILTYVQVQKMRKKGK